MLKDTSVVMCTRNCVSLVTANLPLVRETLAGAEIIIVDGNSSDGTREFASKYADKLLSDEGRGLAYARQLGAENATRPYVLFCGCDNRVPEETVAAMVEALAHDSKLAAVGAQTRVIEARTYWEKTTKYIFTHVINRAGPTDVVGTPSMYRRDALLQVKFSNTVKACDDTDLGHRLIAAGYTMAIVDAYAEEKNTIDFDEYWDRWFGYGRSDAEFYAIHHQDWSLWRKLKSITHPFRKYGVTAAGRFLVGGQGMYIPGLYVAVVARYVGWIQAVRKGSFGREVRGKRL
ncbi:MAG: hypothetical protein RLZZ26_415 [Candidatus Parcubacteria bacterium]|jgi:glycosyltransferase involved in cell wall biosynthesis